MKKTIHGLAAWLVLALLPGAALAVPSLFVENQHYVEIPFGGSPETGNKVEVQEFFWYGCPHCFTLEPVVEDWLKRKPDNALFVRTPALLPRGTVHAKAYYAFEAMGAVDKAHRAMFDAMHIHERKVVSEQDVIDFAVEQGLDKSAFTKTLNSFDVDSKVRQAAVLAQQYGINSVPAFVVDGRYLTNATLAGGSVRLMELINYLVDKAAQERGAKR